MKGKKLWKWAFGIGIATLLFGAFWMLLPTPEPVYDGKSVTHWLRGDLLVWRQDASVTFEPSTNDYPFLMRMVEAQGSASAERFKKWFSQNDWLKLRLRPVTEINANGYQGLISLAPQLEFTVPDLIVRYDHAARGSFERYAIARPPSFTNALARRTFAC